MSTRGGSGASQLTPALPPAPPAPPSLASGSLDEHSMSSSPSPPPRPPALSVVLSVSSTSLVSSPSPSPSPSPGAPATGASSFPSSELHAALRLMPSAAQLRIKRLFLMFISSRGHLDHPDPVGCRQATGHSTAFPWMDTMSNAEVSESALRPAVSLCSAPSREYVARRVAGLLAPDSSSRSAFPCRLRDSVAWGTGSPSYDRPRLQWRGPHRHFTDFPDVPECVTQDHHADSTETWGCQLSAQRLAKVG